MEKDSDQLNVEFNESAIKAFFSLYSDFKTSVRTLDRQKDDNVFQQVQGTYANRLKQQLESIATDLIDKNRSLKDINHVKKTLTDSIGAYVNEFIQKSRSL